MVVVVPVVSISWAVGRDLCNLWLRREEEMHQMSPDLLDRHRLLRLLLGMLVFAVGILLAHLIWSILVTLGDVILLFFLAWIIAFILEPVSILLQKRGLKRVLAVSLIYIALLVVVSGFIVLTIPSIESEVKLLASEITAALSPGNLDNLNSNFVVMLRHLGFSKENAHNIVNSISDQIPALTLNFTSNAVNTTTQLFASILSILFDTFLVLIISFYMMLDGDRLVESFVRRLPTAWIPDVRLFQSYVEQIFGGFFRAQLTIGFIYGILTWMILMIFQQANGLLVGVVSGIIMLLPFIGPPLSIVPPLLLVLLQSPASNLGWNLVLLIIALIIAQQIVMQMLAPRIFGSQMGIHPLLLFAALLIGAKFGGVWGAFFAGPIIAVAYAMARVYYDRFSENSPLFEHRVPAAETISQVESQRIQQGQKEKKEDEEGEEAGFPSGVMPSIRSTSSSRASSTSPH
jgi:predicted PurR-regulated permease PerM